MRLKLSNGFVRVTEGDIGAQFSENVRFAIDSDMDGYVPSLLVKFQNESGEVVEALCQKDGDEFVIPSAAYRQTQVIMLTVSSAKGDEVVNSQPLYVRITEGNSGGAVILPTDEDTWKTAVKAYVDQLLAATNEKISQLEQMIGQGGTGGGIVPIIENTHKDYLPKVFLSEGTLPTTKTSTTMKFEYHGRRDNVVGYVDIKCQGNSSMSYPKKNFTIKLYSDKDKSIKAKHDFGFGSAQQKFVLKANWIDHSHARNIVTSRIWADIIKSRSDYSSLPIKMRTIAPIESGIDGFPVKLYANGVYQGIYTMNVPKDGWMFGMDKKDGTEVILCGEGNNDGDMTKAMSTQFRALTNFTPDVDGQWGLEYPDAIPQATQDSFNALISFVMSSSDADFKASLNDYVDVQSLIDYYLFSYFSCNLDGLAQNMLFITYDGSYWYASAYDLDSTWGLWWNGTQFKPSDYRCPEDYQENNSLLWQRIVKNFADELKNRYEELRGGALSLTNVITRFEEFTDVIPKELYDEDGEIFSGIPSRSTNNIKQIRRYAKDRSEYVDGMIGRIEDSDDPEIPDVPVDPEPEDPEVPDTPDVPVFDGDVNPTWLDEHTYDQATGEYTEASGERCTEKFTVANAGYYTFANTSGSYPAVFVWKKDGSFVGSSQTSAFNGFNGVNLTPDYVYAFKVYGGRLTLSAVARGTNSITIKMSELTSSGATYQTFSGGYGEVPTGLSTSAIKGANVALISQQTPQPKRTDNVMISFNSQYKVLMFTGNKITSLDSFLAWANQQDDIVLYY